MVIIFLTANKLNFLKFHTVLKYFCDFKLTAKDFAGTLRIKIFCNCKKKQILMKKKKESNKKERETFIFYAKNCKNQKNFGF